MKFEVISLNTFEVMPQTKFPDARTDGQGDSSITPPPFRLWGYKNLLKTLCEQERQIVARYARLTPSCKAGACTKQNSSMKNNKRH